MHWGHRWTHLFSAKCVVCLSYVVCLLYVQCLSYVACGACICYVDVYTHSGQRVDTGCLNCSLPLVFLDPWSLWTWNSLIRLTGWPVSFSEPLVSTSLLGIQVHASLSSFYASAGESELTSPCFPGAGSPQRNLPPWPLMSSVQRWIFVVASKVYALARLSFIYTVKPLSHMDTTQQHHYHTLKPRQPLLQQGEGPAKSHCLNLVLCRLPHGRLSTVDEVRIPRAFHLFLPSQICPINFFGLLTSSPWHSLLSKASHFLNLAFSFFFID